MQSSRWGEIREEWKLLNWCNLKVCQQEMVLSLLQWNPLRLNLMEWKLWPRQKVYTHHSATLQQQGKERKMLKIKRIEFQDWKRTFVKMSYQESDQYFHLVGTCHKTGLNIWKKTSEFANCKMKYWQFIVYKTICNFYFSQYDWHIVYYMTE